MAETGSVNQVTINLWNGCHVLRAGHRLRVDVTSSDFPRFDRNANSGQPIGTDTEVHTANQTVFHDASRPSRVDLTVIER